MIERFRKMQFGDNNFTPNGSFTSAFTPPSYAPSTTLTTTQSPMFKIPEQNKYNAETALKDYAINPIEEYGDGLWRNKTPKEQIDPYFLLRGFKTGASWLSEMIERRRQDEYMNRQMSTLGQLEPLPVGDFQPVNNNLYFQRGGIKIDPRNRGKFTAAAKQRGLSIQQFARQVLGNPERYTPLMRQRANFARNARKWNKEEGGTMQQGGRATTADSIAKPIQTIKRDYYLEPPKKKSKVTTVPPTPLVQQVQTPVTGRKDFFMVDEGGGRPSSEQEVLGQMERPQGQPQGQSVFSPSGHLIGVMQGRNFVPLPNEAMREGDRTLLNDKQQLNKYLQSKYGKYALPVMMKGGKYRGKKK